MVKLKELLIFFLIFSFLFFLGCVSGNDAGVDNNLDFDNGEKLNPVTQDCISWFDGCNYCSLDLFDGTIICTELFCEEYSTPYCKEYNYLDIGKNDLQVSYELWVLEDLIYKINISSEEKSSIIAFFNDKNGSEIFLSNEDSEIIVSQIKKLIYFSDFYNLKEFYEIFASEKSDCDETEKLIISYGEKIVSFEIECPDYCEDDICNFSNNIIDILHRLDYYFNILINEN